MNRFAPQLNFSAFEFPPFASTSFYDNYLRKSLGNSNDKNTIFAQKNARENVEKRSEKRSVFAFRAKVVRSLRASQMLRNYYFHLIDFASDESLLCAIGSRLLLYNFQSGESAFVGGDFGISLNCVRAHQSEAFAAAADAKGAVSLFALESDRILRRFSAAARATALDWRGAVLARGGSDGFVDLYDVRSPRRAFAALKAHSADVCAARFASAADTLLCTGGTDARFHVFDTRTMRAAFSSAHHRAAVKPIAWSPAGQLLTGGGTGDERLALWDVARGALLAEAAAGGQVCNVGFVARGAVLATLGWPDHDVQLRGAGLQSAQRCREHRDRVLYLALRPGGTLAATAGADRSVKFWRIEESGKRDRGAEPSAPR